MNKRSKRTPAEWVSIDSVTPWDKNPRVNDHAVDSVAASIQRFGWGSPLIVRAADSVVIAGHTRLKAARKLGLDKVLVRYLDLDPAEAAALALADNKLGELADWSDDDLRNILMELDADEVNLDGLGWTDDELDDLLKDLDLDSGDKSDPPADPPADSVPGQWYDIGPHRLYCGDCRDVQWPEAGCIVYDPPWDLDIQVSLPESPCTLAFSDGARARDVFNMFGAPCWVFVWDAVSSWWTPNRPLRRMKLCLWYGSVEDYDQEGAFYQPSSGKDDSVRVVSNTRGSYVYTPHPDGRRLSDLYSHPITKLHSDEESHRHSKPVEWVRCLIANTSQGLIVDPFAGGGSSLEAAHTLGRRWIGSEIDPRNCDLIRSRLSGVV